MCTRSLPSLTIRLELDAAPRIIVDASTDGACGRLGAWNRGNPDLATIWYAALESFERRQGPGRVNARRYSGAPNAPTFTPEEDAELRALVVQAFDLKGSPYLVDACQAIADWNDRRPLRDLERRIEREAQFLRLLRETSRLLDGREKAA